MKARFRRRRGRRPDFQRAKVYRNGHWTGRQSWMVLGDQPAAWPREVRDHWAALDQGCPDRESRKRLARLVDRLCGHDRGARESALAEVELAVLLIRAGFAIRFLPESQSRTADLECVLGPERVFVEVTAVIGGDLPRSQSRSLRKSERQEDEDEEAIPLIKRLVARISQKARQLVDYREPVVLAITVPGVSEPGAHSVETDTVDLKHLAGTVTLLLPLFRHISAVLLSLWSVMPAPARSGVRLANVHLVERAGRQSVHPRVRMLILNPAAGCPLAGTQIESFKGLL
jgi:hypothetical protein